MSYTKKWLFVNLTERKVEAKDADETLCREYIGGKGLGFALMEKLAPSTEIFGEENPLIFVNGPFTGTKIQTSGRTCLVTRSPLTGSVHDSHCGGNFGPRFKAAGYDLVYIDGKSDVPVYLHITDKGVEIKDAAKYWGKGIFEANDMLINDNPGTDPHAAVIGQAGENLSRMACVGVDKHRQYGRGGIGAVMGSKKLKAIVADGEFPISYYNEEEFLKLNKQLTRDILNDEGVKFRREKGTMKCVRSGQENEFLPTKNFQECTFDDFEGISSETCREELSWEDTGCFNCSIRCSKFARWDNHEIEGPEYETAAFLGSGCMIGDSKDLSWANEICNDLGLDTISVGVTCSFAMECYEKGLLKEWDSPELTWGNAKMQRELIEAMAFRKGIGEVFADGTKVAAQKIGKGSEEFAINTYGMELSGVNPKGALTMAVSLSVADFASHTRLWCTEADMGDDFAIEDIPQTVVDGIDEINVRNSLVICDFVPMGIDRLLPVLNAATGYDYSLDEITEVGRKITNVARRYNVRNGRKASDDTMPDRFFNETSLSGFMRGKKLDRGFFNTLIQECYKIRGWNQNGEPK